jgi:hypothetical protein
MSVDARDILDAVAGYTKSNNTKSSADKPVRIGTIEPYYVSGLPHVQFDGDSVPSQKGFAWAASYYPTAGDRVYLIPVGQSYIIGGKVETADNRFAEHRRAEYTTSNFFVQGGASWDTGPASVDTNTNKTKNNDFSQGGIVNGAIHFTKAGYYSVSCMYVPRGVPGSGWLKLNHNVDGMQGMDDITEGKKHEAYICLAPTYFAVNDYIRSQLSVSTTHYGDTRWKVVAADQY